jgi:alpha-tubulin suppressor-like RCC1 family protein
MSGRQFFAAAFAALAFAAANPAFGQSASSAIIQSSANPSLPGQSVTFTATVAGNGNGAPTGSVTFKDGSTALGGAIALNTLGAGNPIAVGAYHTCALTAAGGVKCWGDNSHGQLGDNSTTERHTPVDVSGLSGGVLAIDAGLYHTCALTVAGGVKCWGDNAHGKLGDNSTTESHTPVDVLGLSSGVVAIAVGYEHACALTAAGGIKCWGQNEHGALGDDSFTDRHVPVDVSGLTSGVAAIASRGNFTCAVTTAGGVKCWGYNHYGNLGNGSSGGDIASPVDVSGLTTGVAGISTGYYHACALTTAGGVKCWGYNGFGQLGDDFNESESHVPVDVDGLGSGIAAITTGGAHTCALTAAGGVKCWGLNSIGEIGDNTIDNRHTPVDVSGLGSGVAAIAANVSGSCALTALGAMTCWGANSNGQIGDNTITPRHVPTAVSGFGSGAALVFGSATLTTSSLAIGSHSIAAAYGGDGTHTASTSPALAQDVALPATTTTLASTDTSSVFGQRVTLTAQATSSGGTPSGSVIFKDGATTLGTKSLSGGSAALAVTSLAVGTHHLKAEYEGDTSYAASTSASLTQRVAKGASTTTLTTAPQTVTTATTMTLTATVKAKAPARGSPTGPVTFKDGAKALGHHNLAHGRAQLRVKLKAGRHRLAASYAGSSQFAPSNSPAKSVTVRARAAPPVRRGTTFAIAGKVAGASSAAAAHDQLEPQDQPAMARLGDGFVVVWREHDEVRSDIYGQRFDSGSAPVGERFVIASGVGQHSGPAAASLSDGGFIVVWGSANAIEAQRFDDDGHKRGARMYLAGAAVDRPALAGLADGGFVAMWTADGGITGQRFDVMGRKAGAWPMIDDAAEPAIAALDDGRFVVAWTRRGDDGSDVFAQRFTANGDKTGAPVRLNTTIANDQSQPSLGALDGGGFVAAWTSDGGIVGRLFDANGTDDAEFILDATAQGDRSQPAVLATDGRLFVAWTSAGGTSASTVMGQSFAMTTRKSAVAER